MLALKTYAHELMITFNFFKLQYHSHITKIQPYVSKTRLRTTGCQVTYTTKQKEKKFAVELMEYNMKQNQ